MSKRRIQRFIDEKYSIKALKNTKVLRIVLGAITRQECSEYVIIPADLDQHDIQELVSEVYDRVDGLDWSEDADYWEQGNCYGEVVSINKDVNIEFALETDSKVDIAGALQKLCNSEYARQYFNQLGLSIKEIKKGK